MPLKAATLVIFYWPFCAFGSDILCGKIDAHTIDGCIFLLSVSDLVEKVKKNRSVVVSFMSAKASVSTFWLAYVIGGRLVHG